jgi:hypothetical protein
MLVNAVIQDYSGKLPLLTTRKMERAFTKVPNDFLKKYENLFSLLVDFE